MILGLKGFIIDSDIHAQESAQLVNVNKIKSQERKQLVIEAEYPAHNNCGEFSVKHGDQETHVIPTQGTINRRAMILHSTLVGMKSHKLALILILTSTPIKRSGVAEVWDLRGVLDSLPLTWLSVLSLLIRLPVFSTLLRYAMTSLSGSSISPVHSKI